MNNREIAEELGLSESFLSRVANGKLSFTFKHLADIERKLNTPLPVLLLMAVREEDVPIPKALKAQYHRVLDVLRASAQLESTAASEEAPE